MTVSCSKCRVPNTDTSRFCSECGIPLHKDEDFPAGRTETFQTPTHELSTGATFAGRYQIIEELGKGGMGRVYRALDKKLDEEVALKLVRPDVASDKQTLDRFSNELKLARKISHKNVGRMYELLEEKGTHYITMEYVPGQDLKGLIRQTGQLTAKKAVSIVRQICEGLVEAHQKGVVHRDLKPGNIMIDRDGNARIMDFGIARIIKGKGITGAGMMIGTPEYMSPEQVEAKEVDERSDIYSLGVLLFEMVAGRLPFESDTPIGIAHQHAHEPPPDPRDFNPQVPDGLRVLILHCLEKKPEARPQTAGEILPLLEEIESGLSSTSRIEPSVISGRTRVGSLTRRIGPAVIASGIIVLLAAVFIFTPGLLKKSPPPDIHPESPWKNSIAVLPFRDSSPGGGQEALCLGMSEAVSVRLSKLGSDIRVTTPQSAAFYQGQGLSIQEIARKLDVRTVLDGTVQREGDKLRVTAHLINAADSSSLWSDMIDREYAKVLDIQDDISIKIAEALQAKLIPGAEEALKNLRPRDLDAYEYYMKGMHFLSSRYIISFDEKDFEESVLMFEKAVEIDSRYMMAYFGLSWAHEHHFYVSEDPEDIRKSQDYAHKAYELEPEHPKTLALKAYLTYAYENDPDKALALAGKAVRADPNDPHVEFLAGVVNLYIGLYDEGASCLLRSIALDPNYFWNPYKLAMCYSDMGEFDKAIYYFDKYYEVSPQSWIYPGRYIATLIKMKDYDEARERIDLEEKLTRGGAWLDRYRALLLAAEGKKEEALALHKDSEIYSLLGMTDEAIASLEKEIRPEVFPAYMAHPHLYYSYMIHNPHFDNIRDDPRFKTILEQEKKLYDGYERKYGGI